MSNLKFSIKYHSKYGSKTVNILHGKLEVGEDGETRYIESHNTEYNHKRLTFKLSEENVEIIKDFELYLNEYLKENNIPEVTLLYGDKIYPKMKSYLSEGRIRSIELKGVFVNHNNKAFPQLWAEY